MSGDALLVGAKGNATIATAVNKYLARLSGGVVVVATEKASALAGVGLPSAFWSGRGGWFGGDGWSSDD